MNDEIKEILSIIKSCKQDYDKQKDGMHTFDYGELYLLYNYITNLQQENKIKDTNWESLKYYLEKLYYKDYIEEAISDDIDKKIKELESKVEIKGYQKDIKALQQENERLNRQIIIMEKYLELICDIGYDYDGYGNVVDTEHLKKLIDELVRFASLGRACNDTEGIYIDNNNIYYNILNEKIERGDEK